MNVGSLTIDPVIDGSARMPATAAFAGTTDEDWAPHRALLEGDGTLEMTLGGFLVRAGDRVVLVDAGMGPFTWGPFVGGQLLVNLAALGVAPDEITDVLFTHLHFDHVGWATQQGRIVFPNATYRCHERDWEHFVGPDEGATKKLLPIADRLEPWSGSGPLLPGIDLMAAAGHTPGSTIVVLSSGDERAMLLGDVVHCPVELLDDEWQGMSDVDPELALRTRTALAKELEGRDIPVAAAHFPGMRFGRLLAASGRRSWRLDGLGLHPG
ncbi:MAG TPA: MBL fold metallo-hydrolase [Acidimicrobiales bacterium]|nr:MBL fold metallo-hydrolase [Acidimicrobiales bacterium]